MKKEEYKYKKLITLCALMLLIFLVACVEKEETEILDGNDITEQEGLITGQKSHINSTNKKAVNGGKFVECNGWFYFILKNGIYRCNEDGSMIEKLHHINDRLGGNTLVVDNDWIYFQDMAEESNTVELYKMNIVDNSMVRMCEVPTGGRCRIYENHLYFSNEYKMDLDTTSPVQIYSKSTGSGYTINIVDDYIYFYDSYDGNDGIYKMTIDGQNITQISSGRTDYMLVDEDWIYFQNQNENSNLYKIKIDGSGVQPVLGEDIRHINSDGEWLYCDAHIDGVTGIYKIKKDRSEYELLTECDGRTDYIYIVNDWIYYSFIGDRNEILRRMRLDGSNNEVFMSMDIVDDIGEEITTN